MRHLGAAGGLAVAACACGLLFSGAASARQAADTINVSGIANGTSIQFSGTGSPFSAISFFGGSNWQFTAISSAGGSCSLTPTNGGAFCSFATPKTSFVADTTINGPTPTAVAGEVGYADTTTGTFSALVTSTATDCHCTHVSVALTDFKREDSGNRLVFYLNWRLDCALGNENTCTGIIDNHGLKKELARHHLHVEYPPGGKHGFQNSDDHWLLDCTSSEHSGCTSDTFSGRLRFELSGHHYAFENLTISLKLGIDCLDVPQKSERNETFTMKFDKHGDLDRKESHLGKVN